MLFQPFFKPQWSLPRIRFTLPFFASIVTLQSVVIHGCGEQQYIAFAYWFTAALSPYISIDRQVQLKNYYNAAHELLMFSAKRICHWVWNTRTLVFWRRYYFLRWTLSIGDRGTVAPVAFSEFILRRQSLRLYFTWERCFIWQCQMLILCGTDAVATHIFRPRTI